MRVAAIDLGAARIGVAVSDASGVLASPRCTIHRGHDPVADRAALVEAIVGAGAAHVVVGLPLHLNGTHGEQARAAAAEAEALRVLLEPQGVAVELFDERLTTVTAERGLRAAGRTGPARRAVIDEAAATVLLQAWLDAHPPERS